MHLTDAELTAFAHGEMPAHDREEARLHVAGCASCASRLERFRDVDDEIAGSLAVLDHDVPSLSADTIIARANGRSAWARRAIAAGIAALVVAGSAAAAAPGSPVRRYVERLFAGGPPPAPAPVPPQPAAPSGVAFVPEGAVEVDFVASQPSGEIRITLGDSPTFRITHRGGSAGYSLTAAGVSVDNAASGASYDIALPRGLERSRIQVGGRVVFATVGSRVTTEAPRDRTGSYVIAFSALTGRQP